MNVALITIEAVVTIQKLFPGVFYIKKNVPKSFEIHRKTPRSESFLCL